jgi:hypothetical protein
MKYPLVVPVFVLVVLVLYLMSSTEYTSTRTNSKFITINYDKTCINGVVYIVRNGGAYKGGITPYLNPDGSLTQCDAE